MKKILRALLALSLVFCLFSCKAKNPDISGNYQLLKIDAGDSSVSEDDMKTLRDMGMDILLTVEKDGTAKLDVFGEITNMTFDFEKMTFSADGSSNMDFKYENKQLILTDSSGSMYFVPVQ